MAKKKTFPVGSAGLGRVGSVGKSENKANSDSQQTHLNPPMVVVGNVANCHHMTPNLSCGIYVQFRQTIFCRIWNGWPNSPLCTPSFLFVWNLKTRYIHQLSNELSNFHLSCKIFPHWSFKNCLSKCACVNFWKIC